MIAELNALKWALRLTPGDVTIITDCDTTNKGLLFKHYQEPTGNLAAHWHQIGKSIQARQGGINVHKITSHQSVELMKTTKESVHSLRGNNYADALATKGAQMHSFGQNLKQKHDQAQKLSRQIQMMMTATAFHTTSHKGEQELPQTQHNKLQTLEAISGHTMYKIGWKAWQCTTCKQRPGNSLYKWLQEAQCPGELPQPEGEFHILPCKGRRPLTKQMAHSSHTLAQYAGITFCWRCGRWSHRVARGLAKKCGDPTARGRVALARLRAKNCPKPHKNLASTTHRSFPTYPCNSKQVRIQKKKGNNPPKGRKHDTKMRTNK